MRGLRQRQQQGAALIVGLVLMMVLTIMAISTMRTSTVELRMASNTQYHETARQLAEAGIDLAISQINNDAYAPAAVAPGIWTPGIFIGEVVAGSGDTYTVDIRYLHSGDPPTGGSRGAGTAEAHFFELQATGRTAARNARSVVRRGFWKYAD
jgi:type IV pilus assembly protein PilX